MRKTTVLLTGLLLVLASFGAFAQKALQLTGKRSGRTVIVQPGTELLFTRNSDSTLSTRHGKLSEVTATDVTIGGEVIPVSDLKVVAVHDYRNERAGDAAQDIGRGLVIAGDIVTHVGLNFFISEDFYVWPVGGTVALVGACIWGLGLLVDEVMSPVIRSGKSPSDGNWEAAIVDTSDNGGKKKKKKKSRDSYDDLYGY